MGTRLLAQESLITLYTFQVSLFSLSSSLTGTTFDLGIGGVPDILEYPILFILQV